MVIFLEKLTGKERKWINTQFRADRSATSFAGIQKICQQMVYQESKKYVIILLNMSKYANFIQIGHKIYIGIDELCYY